MNIPPKLRCRYGENVGVELLISPPDLADNNVTFLAADALSGATVFTVDNGLKFSIGQYSLVGSFGMEKAEIVRIHTSTPTTATGITLNAADNFAHNRGENIVFIPYNQIMIERSVDGGITYSALVTVNIRADSTETYYNHTAGASTDYYRVKFLNSVTSDVSQYSDGIIGTSYAETSAGAVIRAALVTLGEKIDDVITKEFLYTALNEGRTEIDMMPGVERFSFRTSFDYNAGRMIPGLNTVTLPTNLREPDTNKNVLSVRLGTDKLSLRYVDKQAMNRWYEGVVRAVLSTSVTGASTTIVLDSSGDFDPSGAVSISSEDISHAVDVVNYTGNTLATSTLTGVTDITDSHTVGALVWQGVAFGIGLEYTVDNGQIIFSQPFPDDHAGENIWLDYYKKLSDINSDGDLLDEPNYKMFIPYLRYRIKKRRNKELVVSTDADYVEWTQKRDAAVQKEYTGQDVRLIVDIPR